MPPVSPATKPIAGIQVTARRILLAALVAGFVAGLALALFTSLATEPVIQQAIDLETYQRQQQGEPPEPEMVSRATQRGIGLYVGTTIYGVAYSLAFGLAALVVARQAGSERFPVGRGLVLAAASWWSLAAFPQLKYPANPPGVGNPATIDQRSNLYTTFLGLAILGAVLAAVVYRDLGRLGGRWQRPWLRLGVTAAVYAVYALALALLLPGVHEPTTTPAAVISQFRWLSAGGLTVFWLVLAAVFSFLISRPRRS